MVKITVLKVGIHCLKCKKKLIKAVSSLRGIDQIEADEVKGTMTIVGDADPYEIIVKIRKVGKHAEVVSIGPPPGPTPPKQEAPNKPVEDKKPKEKSKPEENKKPEPSNLDQISYVPYNQKPHYYSQHQAQPVAVIHMSNWDEPNTFCTIM